MFLGPLNRLRNPSTVIYLQTCRLSSPLPTGAFMPTPSTPRLLMANIIELAAASNTDADRDEADRVATATAKAVADACSATVAEANRLVAEADRLAAEATRARQDAARAQLVLHGSDPPPPPPNDDDALRVYVDAHAHVVVAALHVQAVVVLHIKSMIPVLLDNLSPNYSQWKVLFLNTLVKYELVDHILLDPPPAEVVDPH
jgi:hypothetical protein